MGSLSRPRLRSLYALGVIAAVAALLAAAGHAGATAGRAGSAPAGHAASAAGPSALAMGVNDDFMLEDPSLSVRTAWFSRAGLIGARWVKLGVYWKQIAPARPLHAADPSDPAYRWGTLDAAVKSAIAARQTVVLMLVEPPAWALGANPPRAAIPWGSWRPNAHALGTFARAVADRYAGHFRDPSAPARWLPRVAYYQAWNEPNLPVQILPQWVRSGRRILPASPGIYRQMLNAVYANVKAVQPHAFVLSAGTAPYGDPPGGSRMAPVAFWRELLCLNGALRRTRCPSPAHFDGIDHHPYALTPSVPAQNADDVSVPDFAKLTRVLFAAERQHTVLPRGPKQLWMTELEWSSRPPDPTGISLHRQAQYLDLAFYELWRAGVSHVFWYLLRDVPYENLTGGGLYFASGQAKPATRAFLFPFVARRGAHGLLTLWGRSPRPGVVAIEVRHGHQWRRALRVHTTRDGIFFTSARLAARSVLRARSGATASLPWAAG